MMKAFCYLETTDRAK